MDPGGLFWHTPQSSRRYSDVQRRTEQTILSLPHSSMGIAGRQMFRIRFANRCGPTCEGSETNCLHRWSDIRQGPALSSTRYRPVPCRKTMQGSAYCPTPLVGRQCLVHEHITSSCSSVVQSSQRYDCRRSFQKTEARVTSTRYSPMPSRKAGENFDRPHNLTLSQ